MNQRRLIAAVFFSIVIVAVLALIVFTEAVNSSATVNVLRLKTSVHAGQVFASTDVDVVPIAAHDNDFNYIHSDSPPTGNRYTQNLSNGDILRPDDVQPVNQQAQLDITVTDPPTSLVAGSQVDIFADFHGEQALIGSQIQVVSANSTQITILIDPRLEYEWITIAAAHIPLHAVLSTGQAPPGKPIDSGSAIQGLCGANCAGALPAPSPTA